MFKDDTLHVAILTVAEPDRGTREGWVGGSAATEAGKCVLRAVLFFVIRKRKKERTLPSLFLQFFCFQQEDNRCRESPPDSATDGELHYQTCLIIVNQALTIELSGEATSPLEPVAKLHLIENIPLQNQ